MEILAMSPLQIKFCAAAALSAALVVLCLARRRPVSRSGTWARVLVAVAVVASWALCAGSFMDYKNHGAFYDESWRDPNVESHFMFTTADTEALGKAYAAGPDSFDFESVNVLLVKLGCSDCEAAEDALLALYRTGGYAVVFSNSDVGRAYVDYYGVSYVPSVVYAGTVIELRSGSAAYGDGSLLPDVGSMTDALMDGGSPDVSSGPGTKAESDRLWAEAQAEKESQDPAD